MTARKRSKVAQKAPSPAKTAVVPECHDRYGDLEGDLCDVTNMAGILSDMVLNLVQHPRAPSWPAHVYLPKDEENKLSYAALEVSTQLLTLKSRFYAILNAENEERRATKGGAQ